jgi:hypothetical protein
VPRRKIRQLERGCRLYGLQRLLGATKSQPAIELYRSYEILRTDPFRESQDGGRLDARVRRRRVAHFRDPAADNRHFVGCGLNDLDDGAVA